jgi:hypothetical protein
MAIPKRTLILFIILVLLSIVTIIVLIRNPYPVVEVVAMTSVIE